jgi:hypothetical protein
VAPGATTELWFIDAERAFFDEFGGGNVTLWSEALDRQRRRARHTARLIGSIGEEPMLPLFFKHVSLYFPQYSFQAWRGQSHGSGDDGGAAQTDPIEYALVHWVLDVTFREDESRIRMGHGPEDFAILRHIALNLLCEETPFKGSIKTKRLKCGWNDAYLAKVLNVVPF